MPPRVQSTKERLNRAKEIVDILTPPGVPSRTKLDDFFSAAPSSNKSSASKRSEFTPPSIVGLKDASANATFNAVNVLCWDGDTLCKLQYFRHGYEQLCGSN